MSDEARIEVVVGDLTALDVDALVNAANRTLLGGGGVDGAIHRAAGPRLLDACRQIEEVAPGVRCPTGEARITPGFGLRARWVIHAVGPVWQGRWGSDSPEARLLASAYHAALDLAAARRLDTVAFPAISTGAYGYPPEEAAAIAVPTIRAFLAAHVIPRRVLLVAYNEANARALRRAVEETRDSRKGD
ncbi:MAG TPA: O-acetyl-ADP-ribose deacetylase [Rubricoccaceae bacterium]|nr:O-acetyl-ADP-ribose deacetylase [Rubricoccaceae bacterium]